MQCMSRFSCLTYRIQYQEASGGRPSKVDFGFSEVVNVDKFDLVIITCICLLDFYCILTLDSVI